MEIVFLVYFLWCETGGRQISGLRVKIPHMGNTWPSRTCVIQEYRYYTMSLSLYHESMFIPLVHVYTIVPCLYNLSMFIPWVLVNSMGPCLLPWVLANNMNQCLYQTMTILLGIQFRQRDGHLKKETTKKWNILLSRTLRPKGSRNLF